MKPNFTERLSHILKEFSNSNQKLEDLKIQNTIVMFGSARIKPPKESQKQLDNACKNNLDAKIIEKMKYEVEISQYYQAAYELAYKLANWSKQFKEEKKFYICSGAGGGIMEAANKGAYDANEKTIGLNIDLPFEQNHNPFLKNEEVIDFHYFFLRKFWFSYYAKAIVVFPGGFGTLDELFENLTLIQTHKMIKNIPVVMFGKKFFDQLMNLSVLEKYSLISETDLKGIFFTDSIEEAFDYITSNIRGYENL